MALQHDPQQAPVYQGGGYAEFSPQPAPVKVKKPKKGHIGDTLPLAVCINQNTAGRFICQSCQRIPLKVYSCDQAHIFCKKCIDGLCRTTRTCPVSKHTITSKNENNPIPDNMVMDLQARCLFSITDDGGGEGGGGVTNKGPPAAFQEEKASDSDSYCSWTGNVSQLIEHVSHCKFAPMDCAFNDIGCSEEIKKSSSNMKKVNSKIVEHYSKYNREHQDCMLQQILILNSTVRTMQSEINDLRSIINTPGNSLNDMKMSIDNLYKLVQSGHFNNNNNGGNNNNNANMAMNANNMGNNANGGDDGKNDGIFAIDHSRNTVIVVGCNEKGDFGNGDDDNISKLSELKWTHGKGIKAVYSCSYKAFCWISSDNIVFVSGCNDFGQLGTGTEDDEWESKIHPFFGNKIAIWKSSRSVNAFHVFWIGMNKKDIYCSGANEYGQLGLKDENNVITPQLNDKNSFFTKGNIIDIECGEFHSLFLLKDGSVWSCGLNESFQLGYKTKEDSNCVPTKIAALEHVKCVGIACGRDHSFCLDSDGCVWSFGSNRRGQLGVSKENWKANTVLKIGWLERHNKKITHISSGNYHGAAVDRAGNVFVWGRGDEGQIGNGKKGDRYTPSEINLSNFNNEGIESISCGCHHTVVCSKNQTLYCWGNNRYNQSADTYVESFDTKHNAIFKPKEYYKLKKEHKMRSCSAGSYHTILVYGQ